MGVVGEVEVPTYLLESRYVSCHSAIRWFATPNTYHDMNRLNCTARLRKKQLHAKAKLRDHRFTHNTTSQKTNILCR